MIVTCPACATRHDFPNALRAPGDVRITCRSCGHRWIEIEADDVIDIEPARYGLPSIIDERDDEREPDEAEVRRLIEAARLAQETFAERKRQRSRALRAWAVYGLVALSPLAGLALFPETVVHAAPAAIRAYEVLGLGVNLYGLEIRRVQQQHSIIKGVRVLTIRGDIVNVTGDTRRIPWLRFGLRDAAAAEVYQWTLDTAARPLRAGEVTSFVTRVAAPPEQAFDLQIRFAHEDEIGSKVGS